MVGMPDSPSPAYTYLARLVRVIDGDTYELELDFGKFTGVRVTATVTIRLAGVDTPERTEPGWTQAREFAADTLSHAGQITVRTYKSSFARTVADVWVAGQPLAELIIAAGHGVVSHG